MAVNIPISVLNFAVLIITCSFCLKLVWASTNRISTTKSIKDPETIVSNNGLFKLGFFSPTNSTDRYVGIWYNIINNQSDPLEIVWVANRNNPIKHGSSGVLKISEDNNNLQLVSETQNITFWSSNNGFTESGPENSTTITQLEDEGQLEMFFEDEDLSRNFIWSSFYDLKTTILPETRLYIHKNDDFSNDSLTLMSWKNDRNPVNGSFILRLIANPLPEFVTEYVHNSNNKCYWRSGPWDGNQFIGVPGFSSAAGNGFRILNFDDNEGYFDFMFSVSNQSQLVHYVLNYDGNMLQKKRDDGRKEWLTAWKSMVSDCDVYGKCGEFGSCNGKKSPICSCLDGFEPKNKDEWRKGEWSNGCVRKTALRNCSDKAGKEDGFLRLKNRKVPDFGELLKVKGGNEDECRIKCLGNCSCLAYANPDGIGCMMWSNTRSLIDIQEFASDGADLFIRLSHLELGESGNRKLIISVVAIIISATTLLVFVYCLWSWKRRTYGHKPLNKKTGLKDYGLNEEDLKHLTLFKFKVLEIATNYFSETKKLGRGGFGPVYKGELENGLEIAVKRLCSPSGQGLQEFMNEVVLISKLQHRNLVKLLGCCVQGEEKLLVYEYMPNKSLDALLFDSSHQKELNWKKRFDIINGICRGLHYLHRDSRLKIIHRDLKASNILLDEELNPKISDFGIARKVEPMQDQATTIRVVGTYGYMPPEYAMEGRFSEKSDVYSLGVLLLEIVSGKKNTSHLIFDSLTLLTYAWKLWNDKDMLSFVDHTILDPSFEGEILKCIQLGLLCVQEFPEDRPTISTVLYMLEVCDVMDLPHPTQPAFTHRNTRSTYNQESINQITLTEFNGR